MINKYKQFNEGITQYLKGPTEEELLKGLSDLTPDKMLLKSAELNFFKGVEIALEKGANINTTETSGTVFGALYRSFQNKNYKMVEFLLNKGADVNVGKGCLLFFPVKSGDYKLTKTLIDKGINVNPPSIYINRDLGSASILDIAIRIGDENIINLLINSGTSVTSNKNSALKYAVYNCVIPLVKLLLTHGANPNVYNKIEKKFNKVASFDDMINTLKLLKK